MLRALAFPKVTVPAPLSFDHVVDSVPLGKPSSVAVPDRFAAAGSVIVWFPPTLTAGAVFVVPPFVTDPFAATTSFAWSVMYMPLNRNC